MIAFLLSLALFVVFLFTAAITFVGAVVVADGWKAIDHAPSGLLQKEMRRQTGVAIIKAACAFVLMLLTLAGMFKLWGF